MRKQGLFVSVIGFFVVIVNLIRDFSAMVMRHVRNLAERIAFGFKLVAYLVIAPWLPMYRESYVTHGLSLGHRRRS